MNDIAILGVGLVTGTPDENGMRLEEMVFQAASQALLDAGVTRDQVDNVVLAACDELDGRSISSMLTAAPAGAYLKDEIKVTNDGSYAAILAAMRILSGVFDVSLVVSWSKTSESPVDSVMSMRLDPFYHRGLGLNHLTVTALMAKQYKEQYGLSDDVTAKIVANSNKQGRCNQNIFLKEEILYEDVLQSPYLAYPLKRLEVAPYQDAAVAIVMASRGTAERLSDPDKMVFLKGFGWSTDSYYLGQRDLTHWTSLEKAVKQALDMSGVEHIHEIDVFEISDHTAYHHIAVLEGLGLIEHGKGEELIHHKAIRAAKKALAINPSGGALYSDPYFCAGLVRVVEAYKQVAGRAGNYQVEHVDLALAHSENGFAGQANAVFILGR